MFGLDGFRGCARRSLEIAGGSLLENNGSLKHDQVMKQATHCSYLLFFGLEVAVASWRACLIGFFSHCMGMVANRHCKV